MSDAKKCDVCGKYYEHGFVFLQGIDKGMDICDSCKDILGFEKETDASPSNQEELDSLAIALRDIVKIRTLSTPSEDRLDF